MGNVEIRTDDANKPEKKYVLELVHLNKLIPHEMVIRSAVDDFKIQVVDVGYLMRPILVDKNSNLILDGHHRQKGLAELGYTEAPVIMIDYLDGSEITLDTWYPLLNYELLEVIEKLREIGILIEESTLSEIDLMQKLSSRDFTAIIGNHDTKYIIADDRESLFETLKDNWLVNIQYYDTMVGCFEGSSPTLTAVVSWSYTKQEVLENVRNGMIHLPKTTRHNLKYRYADCNFPLHKLGKSD